MGQRVNAAWRGMSEGATVGLDRSAALAWGMQRRPGTHRTPGYICSTAGGAGGKLRDSQPREESEGQAGQRLGTRAGGEVPQDRTDKGQGPKGRIPGPKDAGRRGGDDRGGAGPGGGTSSAGRPMRHRPPEGICQRAHATQRDPTCGAAGQDRAEATGMLAAPRRPRSSIARPALPARASAYISALCGLSRSWRSPRSASVRAVDAGAVEATGLLDLHGSSGRRGIIGCRLRSAARGGLSAASLALLPVGFQPVLCPRLAPRGPQTPPAAYCRGVSFSPLG